MRLRVLACSESQRLNGLNSAPNGPENHEVIRVFQLEHYCAGRVVAERRIETKRVTVEYRSLGFDTLRYSTCVR